jgi:hypothetical protein
MFDNNVVKHKFSDFSRNNTMCSKKTVDSLQKKEKPDIKTSQDKL